MTHCRTLQALPLGLLLAVSLLAACGGRQTTTAPPAAECARHNQCSAGRWCVEARCVRGDGDEPVQADDWFAEGWFSDPDSGSCTGDEMCGPWVCDAGACVAPSDAGRALPARSAFAYWDTSCVASEHCPSDWVCARNWCTPIDHLGDASLAAAPTNEPEALAEGYLLGALGAYDEAWPEDELLDIGGLGVGGFGTGIGVAGSGSSCVADTDCLAGEDCIAPGFCAADVADEFMTWDDTYAPIHFTYGDQSCNSDQDCGGFVCDVGYCDAPEYVLPSVPLRREILYYDGSCTVDDDCGPWQCDAGWCRDPARIE